VTNVNIPGYCGAGFVGSYIVEKLLERKDSVRVLDNFATGDVKCSTVSGASFVYSKALQSCRFLTEIDKYNVNKFLT